MEQVCSESLDEWPVYHFLQTELNETNETDDQNSLREDPKETENVGDITNKLQSTSLMEETKKRKMKEEDKERKKVNAEKEEQTTQKHEKTEKDIDEKEKKAIEKMQKAMVKAEKAQEKQEQDKRKQLLSFIKNCDKHLQTKIGKLLKSVEDLRKELSKQRNVIQDRKEKKATSWKSIESAILGNNEIYEKLREMNRNERSLPKDLEDRTNGELKQIWFETARSMDQVLRWERCVLANKNVLVDAWMEVEI